MEKKGVRCGMCTKRYCWDWCSDLYRDVETGEFVAEETLTAEKANGEERELVLMKCTCGYVLGVTVNDYVGSTVYNNPGWEGVNWDSDDNACDDEEEN